MNVGFAKTIQLSRSGKCVLQVVMDVNHYFHIDYGVDRVDNVWNHEEGDAVRYEMIGGKFGSHTLPADGTNRKRLLAHWEGYCKNNDEMPTSDFKVIKRVNKKYWC